MRSHSLAGAHLDDTDGMRLWTSSGGFRLVVSFLLYLCFCRLILAAKFAHSSLSHSSHTTTSSRRFRGGIVGYERREADRPAGIRTMSLVSLGACLFSINSAFAFLDGPMSWDSSRIAAAIPSGVGFLGAGLIFKEAEKNKKSGDTTHVVHGLTTAASLWIVSDA